MVLVWHLEWADGKKLCAEKRPEDGNSPVKE